MSRLESNAEPSMEEILASIRKIIAEDSTGLRAPATSPRSGTPYSPAQRAGAPQPSSPAPTPTATPQRGFMSREAFLKSSQPAEPEQSEDAYAPLGAARSAESEPKNIQPSSRLRPLDENPLFDKPAHSLSSRDDVRKEPVLPIAPVFPAAAKEQSPQSKPQVSAPSRSSPSFSDAISATSETDDTETIETIEIIAIQDVLPVVKSDAPSVLKAEPEPIAVQSAKSNTATIEAQLTELLSEDLNALRNGRAKVHAEETAAKSSEAAKSAPSAQPSAHADTQSNQTRSSEGARGPEPEGESNDPFAFDLGPSPFASKPDSKAPASAAPVSPVAPEAAPAAKPSPSETAAPASAPAKPPAPASAATLASEPSPAAARPSPVEAPAAKSSPVHGTPYFGPFVPASAAPSPAAPAPYVPPANTAQPPNAQPEANPPRARQTFVVPSVSATLGPSRKLEPLSNAFQPVPPPPPSAMETFSPAAESEPPRQRELEAPWAINPAMNSGRAQEARHAAQPPAAKQHGEGTPREETPPRSTLPATTADSSLDRPMEDAVADLLRPLLKTWLAENMPKIVERALRREMSERLLPGQKNTRD